MVSAIDLETSDRDYQYIVVTDTFGRDIYRSEIQIRDFNELQKKIEKLEDQNEKLTREVEDIKKKLNELSNKIK
ncbi:MULTISPECIES: hypothetical protein [Dickeya]|uniref:hypothetical protein n=1 Tax=Dickeya TaxID=204037 RepID=UPI0015D06554|nr:MULTISPECIES: hypothetical protein [Dickeya]ULR31121.1 hypothetical protein MJO48_22420 [Dickeya fangzhongdai]UMB76828.1 hypothetical protein FXN80_22750 [Dickeya fangzhongdai]WOX98573.1 hypothetical protein OGM22_12895 [Dickeya fangzhongdai]WOY06275.1 hypothetical protein OGM21_09520 [Dickeya fangzhongdai]GGC13726.1 hypothetical protein GCM10007171_33690 [Dickeya fangzhongdai]